jgi:hypothetical protein
VLEFERPVALRPRPLETTGSKVAVVGLALGAVSAGVVARQLRRRRAE